MGQHWFRKWLVNCTAQSHYFNQWWLVVNSTKSKSQYNKANLRDLIAATGLVILLKLDSHHQFSAHVTLKFDGWPRKTIGHVFCTISSFVHHFKSIGEFKLELQSGNTQFWSKLVIFVPCDLEIWWKTLENDRPPLLYHVKLCESFQSHGWIQIGSYSPETLNLGQKRWFFCPVWPWNLTDDPEKQ